MAQASTSLRLQWLSEVLQGSRLPPQPAPTSPSRRFCRGPHKIQIFPAPSPGEANGSLQSPPAIPAFAISCQPSLHIAHVLWRSPPKRPASPPIPSLPLPLLLGGFPICRPLSLSPTSHQAGIRFCWRAYRPCLRSILPPPRDRRASGQQQTGESCLTLRQAGRALEVSAL